MIKSFDRYKVFFISDYLLAILYFYQSLLFKHYWFSVRLIISQSNVLNWSKSSFNFLFRENYIGKKQINSADQFDKTS